MRYRGSAHLYACGIVVGILHFATLAGGQVAPEAAPRSLGRMIATRQADEHVRYAFDLVGHGAVHSAQAEFLRALQSVSQALDTEAGSDVHCRALSAGLTAFQEAEDFAEADARRSAGGSIAHLVASHRTPTLKKADLDPMTPLFAMQNYYAFAENELALAGGHQPAASLALYGWARLQALLGGTTPGGAQPAKAVALHRAALKIDPRNYLAANELAVLMARYGESEEARQLLLHSLSLTQRSETLHNLAVVCETLGRREEAAAARKHCQEAMSAERADPQTQGTLGGMVYWVDRQTFSQHADPSELGNAPSGSARSAQAQQPAPPKNQSSDPLANLVLNAWKRLTGASVENKPAAPPSISVN